MPETVELHPRPYIIRTLLLPASVRKGAQVLAEVAEHLPIPVHAATGLPARYASRWLLRSERWSDMPSTLQKKAEHLARLYHWGTRFPGGIDGRIERNEPFTIDELDTLVVFIRESTRPRTRALRAREVIGTDIHGNPVLEEDANEQLTYSVTTVANALATFRRFLLWAVAPEGRGSIGTIDSETAARAATAIHTSFADRAHGAGKGRRIRPMTLKARAAFDEIIAPIGERIGETWHPDNPWTAAVRLRNYCMLGLSRHCGLRPGEVLSLTESDVFMMEVEVEGEEDETGELTTRKLPVVRIVRRHNAGIDTRKRKQYAKTLSRIIPLPAPLYAALIRYLRAAPPVGRRGAETPLLFISTQGEGALTKVSLDKVANGVRRALWKRRRLQGTSPHGLRHTFFEEQADHLLARQGATVESISNILRRMGGWEFDSREPFRYAQNAFGRRGNQHLVAFNERRFRAPTAMHGTTPVLRNHLLALHDDEDSLPF